MCRRSRLAFTQARTLMGESITAIKADAKGPSFVGGTVKLVPKLAALVSPDDTLFIYARAEGSPIPVAILKKRAADLPLTFRLDDSHSMSPAARISAQRDVLLSARILH